MENRTLRDTRSVFFCTGSSPSMSGRSALRIAVAPGCLVLRYACPRTLNGITE